MIRQRKILTIEFTVIILLWTFVIISPLLFMGDFNRNMHAIHVMWAEYSVVVVAFLINRFVLMPQLFFVKRYVNYIISLGVLLSLFAIFVLYFDGVNEILSLFGAKIPEIPALPMMHGAPPQGMPPTFSVIPPAISVLIFMVIVIALDMGLSIAVRWIISEQRQAASDNARVTAQLSNLQSQVSPHFFMNTLNNIHALVDIDSGRAKQTIIELSELMDYLLYDSSNKEEVALRRELNFINSYVNLMRLRYPKEVMIQFSHSDTIPSVKIPPLLFLNFIENAFKYGIDYEQESFVNINFTFGDDSIEMTVINSNHSDVVKSSRHGLGLSNSRKRLDLLYGELYSLDICDAEAIYAVTLKLPRL